MIKPLWWLLFFIAAFGTGYSQLRYAKANYPNTWQWLVKLFAWGFTAGFLGMLGVIPESLTPQKAWLFICGIGLFSGFIFAFVFPYNVQNVYPKRKE